MRDTPQISRANEPERGLRVENHMQPLVATELLSGPRIPLDFWGVPRKRLLWEKRRNRKLFWRSGAERSEGAQKYAAPVAVRPVYGAPPPPTAPAAFRFGCQRTSLRSANAIKSEISSASSGWSARAGVGRAGSSGVGSGRRLCFLYEDQTSQPLRGNYCCCFLHLLSRI